MKIVDRYISFSILKTGLATLLICTLIILAVELFGQMNDYLTSQLPFSTILQLSILAVPEYLMMCISISFLFATTFFLSQLEGNNEMIMLLNSGLSYRRVCRPVILTVLAVTLIAFAAGLIFIILFKIGALGSFIIILVPNLYEAAVIGASDPAVCALIFAIVALAFFAHRSNLVRMFTGTENRTVLFGKKKKKNGEDKKA